jgi:cell division septation protein DedD
MLRFLTLCVAASLAVGTSAAAQGGARAAPDPVFARAQQMITAGHDSAGRAVLDSVLAATPDGTPRYAEALFWRGSFSKTSAGAERDYRRVVVEYPLSPRASESLLRLAQLEMTRRDRASARMHLERLQREHPGSVVSTRGNVLLARLAFGDGDDVVGCAAVAAAKEDVAAADIELRNQLEYYTQRCANLAARTAARDTRTTKPAAAAPPAGVARDTSDNRPPASAEGSRAAGAGAPAPAREFSVQVAAYDTRAEAEALAKRLSDRGYTARIVGTERPYRVRIGRYATRERASAARREVGGRAIVVDAEPR